MELKDLLRGILRVKPDNRLSLDQILDHTWTTAKNRKYRHNFK